MKITILLIWIATLVVAIQVTKRKADKKKKEEICKLMDPMRGNVFIRPYPSGTIGIARQYSDNELGRVRVEIYLSPHDWYEIREKSFYQELKQYLGTLKTE